MATAKEDRQLENIVKGLLGMMVVLLPVTATGPICPYSRYVLEHGVETRKLTGTRDDN
jgi:hypothetical protein